MENSNERERCLWCLWRFDVPVMPNAEAPPAVAGAAICSAALTESMAHIGNMGFCVVLKCLPDGFPWLDDECKPIVCKKWAAEAQWVKHGDGYRPREHATGDTPEEVIGRLETLIAAQSMRQNIANTPHSKS